MELVHAVGILYSMLYYQCAVVPAGMGTIDKMLVIFDYYFPILDHERHISGVLIECGGQFPAVSHIDLLRSAVEDIPFVRSVEYWNGWSY
ncbi:hypothetical protein ACOSQ3_030354 [Xanthoceras sorbifolium]